MHKTGLCVDSNSANRTILKRIKVISFWSSWYQSYIRSRYAHCARKNKRKFAFESCMAVCVCVHFFFLEVSLFFAHRLHAASCTKRIIAKNRSAQVNYYQSPCALRVRTLFFCFVNNHWTRKSAYTLPRKKKKCYEWNIRIIWAIRAYRFISHAAHSRNCAGAIIAMWIELDCCFICVCVCARACFMQVYDINEH